MNILYISSWFPYPPINGAKIRVFNLLRELSKYHRVTLLSFVRTFSIQDANKNIPELEKYCQSVKVVEAKGYIPEKLSPFTNYFSRLPNSVVQTFSPEMADYISKEVLSNSYSVVVASEVNQPSTVSFHASKVRDIPIVLDALEVGLIKDAYLSQTRLWKRIRQGLTWYKLQDFTKSMIRVASAITVPSQQEKQNILNITATHKPIEIIPHSLDLDYYSERFDSPKVNSIVFTGSFTYYANLDAAVYLLGEIYPLGKRKNPDVLLRIVGDTNNIELNRMGIDKSVIFTGLLKDVRSLIAGSWLSIVPLRVGAGTRLKIVESMALGTPVISTSKGAEGLDVTNGENIIIADSPQDIAQAVISVMQDQYLRQKLSEGGRELIRSKYSSYVIGKQFSDLLDQLVKSE